jgi:hypothetical protein
VGNRPLPPISRQHLAALTGELGIWQHATGPVPNKAFGYCTDDVARALTVDLLHARQLGWDAVESSAWRSLRFLRDAYDPVTGRFRNFRGADGAWLDGEPSEDSHGRALLALGIALRDGQDSDFRATARRVFGFALPATSRLRALRATASSLLGCAAALDGIRVDDAFREDTGLALLRLAARLRVAFAPTGDAGDWQWPEPVLTYENALLPQALMVAGERLGDVELGRAGLRALHWLIEVQATVDGRFSPIGNRGFWRRGGPRARFDQQPIEATSLILAAGVAFAQTAEPRYLDAIERAYGWFLGDNDAGVSVADPARGACHDGLEPFGVNLNQGAESTLMWLTALELVRDVRRVERALPAPPVQQGLSRMLAT